MKNTVVIKASKRQSFTEEQKKELLCQFFSSNMTRNAFAKQHGINPASLTQWRDQYGEAVEQPETALVAVNSSEDGLCLLHENERLKGEVKKLSDEIYQYQAFVGKKMFEQRLRD